MADFLRQAAPEVFAASADSFPRIVRQDEVGHCARRIDALLNGDEIDRAARVLEEALADYPGQSKLAACEARLKEKKARGTSKRTKGTITSSASWRK